MNENVVLENDENTSPATGDPAAVAQKKEGTDASPQADPDTDSEVRGLSSDPCADPDSDPLVAVPSGAGIGIDELRRELTELRQMLESKGARDARIDREYGEFHELYPDVALSGLPDALWEDVEKGVPLAAAYALYERRQMRREEQAMCENRKNRERAAGSLNSLGDGEFSPSEVRAMSASEVRKNFSKIMRSMQKWR